MTLDTFKTNSSSPPERREEPRVIDVNALRQSQAGRWRAEQRRRSQAGPRDCCLVSPETAHEHGQDAPTDIPGVDDEKAEAQLLRRQKGLVVRS